MAYIHRRMAIYYYSARKLILILPSHGGWKAESTIGTHHAALYNIKNLLKVFSTVATWPGVEPGIYDTLVRRSIS